jgi:hypothetical protein
MLTFYINRAGDTLPKGQKKHLEDAKDELPRCTTSRRARRSSCPRGRAQRSLSCRAPKLSCWA